MKNIELVSLETVRERKRERELHFSKIKNSFIKYRFLKDSDGT